MKNDKRYAKNFKKRALKQTALKMESLAAAFLKETGLQASETCLFQSTEMIDNVPVFKLWFSSVKADLQGAHPDIAYQADLLSAIYQFSRDKPVESWTADQQLEVQGWLQMVADHMSKYEDQTTAVGVTDDHQAKGQEADQQVGELEPSNPD